MDVIVAFRFGGIFLKSVTSLGVRGHRELSKVFIKSWNYYID